MTIPGQLIDKVKQGKVILFLGSGALYGATLPGKGIPLGNDLRDILCDRFLNDSFKSSDLAHVAAMAISQTCLFDVQDFIKDYFAELEPADFHKQIPKFKWRALFTTNYDLLIENCYKGVSDSLQDLCVILNNEDNFDETRITNNKLPYLKLHGCVTRTHDAALPLILTTDQYNDCLIRRDRLFRQLYELAYENTLVFVGHSLLDHNIRNVLLKLEKEAPHGQRHYLIKPGIDGIERDFWGEKKITALDVSFKDFIEELCSDITDNDRVLSLVRPPVSHPIQSVFSTHSAPSDELVDFLTNQVEYVTSDISVSHNDPKDFFRGVDQEWSPVVRDVAIRRGLQKVVFEEVIERPDVHRSVLSDFFVVKGEAGSGKTVLLRQLAWEASNASLGVILWVRKGCVADYPLIEEIISKANERVFVFWDDAAINSIELNRFMLKARRSNARLTVITAERYNEWNVRCDELDELVTDNYELRYLSETEIENLVIQLEKNDSLGPNLIGKSHADRCQELRDVHGRQLLVALHEATMGEPFEDIVFNEYENIFSESAKKIYLTVCTLNRLRIPVRAGLVSRIHDISFNDFTSKFHKPLEKVVITKGSIEQDVHYSARHSEIAEIVFRRALFNVEERYHEYITIVKKMNVSFSSDRLSFRALVKAKSLSELFPNYEDVLSIYKYARETIGDDSYLLQQMANYERIRPNGSLDAAAELLFKAKETAPYDSSILHSLYVVWRDKAERSDDLHLKRKCRGEARGYLDLIVSKWGMNSYISSSMIELSIDALSELLSDESATSVSIRDAIKKVQHGITENKRQYPAEGHLFSLEAKFAKLIDDDKRALVALQRSFEEGDREPYLAIRLASNYQERGDIGKAKEIFQQALERRRTDHKLNYHYAELLRNNTDTDRNNLMYYYRRGFTPSDSNYQAQFWFARYAFNSNENNNHGVALDIFGALRKARMSHGIKKEIRDHDLDGDSLMKFSGVIRAKRSSFGFIRMDGAGHDIFFPICSVEDDMWDAMREGDRVYFNLGYSFSGAVACHIIC